LYDIIVQSVILLNNYIKQKDYILVEKTLIILKPDAVQRGLVGDITGRMERKGLKLIGLKMMRLDSALLQAHYSHIVDKPFYAGIEEFMKSSPVVIMAWEGFECIASVRLLVGSTNPRLADAGTIRGDLAIGQGRNLIHASDSKKSGEDEVARFFEDEEMFNYDKSEYGHIYEDFERK
jgi:nucleoside-diphosphate kinase